MSTHARPVPIIGCQFPHPSRRSHGFTLLELLTVIAIIALLIGILLPSLSRARDQAKRVKVRATLAAIDKALEMFQNDFGEYPNSRTSIDPIVDFSSDGKRGPMQGAHWLARALVGHDFRGVDAAGRSLSLFNDVSKADLENSDRRGPYLEDVKIVLDTDARFADAQAVPTERSARPIVMDDVHQSPILYYRANTRTVSPFCVFGDGVNDQNGQPPVPGVYRLADNQRITGRWDDGADSSLTGWDFANTGISPHPLAAFGSIDPGAITQPTPFYPKGKTFTGFLHNANALQTSAVVKPVNPESFILIDAGKDGLYGTGDDVTNFDF